MFNSVGKKFGYAHVLLLAFAVAMAACMFALGGCSTPSAETGTEPDVVAPDDETQEAQDEPLLEDALVSDDDTKPEAADEQNSADTTAEGPCYVISNVIINDAHGDQIAEITYTLDERGGTDKVISQSTADDGRAVWDYTLDEDGLPETVDFEFTSTEGNDAYQTVYEYGGVKDGLPASESSIAEFLNDNGEMSDYEYVYDYEYENGYMAKSSYRIYEDGEELTTQSKSQTYDPETGVLKKYESNYMTINFKTKKNSEGQIQTVDFTIAGQSYTANCTYNDNGTIAALEVIMRSTGDGFTIVPEYTEIENPYPQVRANSKSFIWNGLTAELGL